MHDQIQKLYTIAGKESRKIIGLMSGTSMDGLDIALCEISGSGLSTKLKLEKFITLPYSQEIKDEIVTVFSKKSVSLEKLTLLHPWMALQHAKMVNQSLASWNIHHSSIDLIASHGQTVFHAPKSLHPEDAFGTATLQIGDGDHLAVNTGIITISDFRQKHIAAGGEGAPLAVYGDFILCSHTQENRVLLNIGGIANFTFLPANEPLIKVVSTDTGPGNTLMDAYMRLHCNKPFDKDGIIAAQGKVHEDLLQILKSDPFFLWTLPKTSGPELFNLSFVEAAIKQVGANEISIADTMATLNRFTAETIVETIQSYLPSVKEYSIYISGGGVHNPVLIGHLRSLLPNITIKSSDDIGIHEDAKEAILFAILANEMVAGAPMLAGGNATKIPISMGKISMPT